VSGHTPGPWRWSTYHGGVTTATVSRDGCVSAIADIPAHHGGVSREANARLIAAAPDLLNALHLLAAHTHPRTLDDHAAINIARAAIAKAEGGAS